MTVACNLLVNWKQDPHNMVSVIGRGNNGMGFTHVDVDDTDKRTTETNTDKRTMETMFATRGHGQTDKPQITCCNCGGKGHYLHECMEKEDGADKGQEKKEKDSAGQSGTQMLMAAVEASNFDDNDSEFAFLQVNKAHSHVSCSHAAGLHMNCKSALLGKSMPMQVVTKQVTF